VNRPSGSPRRLADAPGGTAVRVDDMLSQLNESLHDSGGSPYTRIEHGSLLVWYGVLERPALSLAPIPLESLRPTR
jgi:hypothetical protein